MKQESTAQKMLKDVIRKKLSIEWVGDQEAYLYHEAVEWIKRGWFLTDDHFEALKSYQRRRLTDSNQTTLEGV